MALYVGLTYLAVGTISVSQINTRFGDQASFVFHLADIADQQRRTHLEQLRQADHAAEDAQEKRDAAMVELTAQCQRLGLPVGQLQKALDDATKSVRLADFGIMADPDTHRNWDLAVTSYYRENTNQRLMSQRRDRLLTQLRGGLAALTGAHAGDDKVIGNITQSQFQNAASTAAGLRSFGYAWLFSIPTEVLTLILALVLGALGSALAMTKIMLEDGAPSKSWYIFRPAQGILMALVVFVLLKAGQLTMAAGDSDALNPFFVAFVGVVSGLLSSDAYRLIQKTGASIIPPDRETGARWGIGLANAMRQAGIDADSLALGIGVKTEEVRSWMEERSPAPLREQDLIAAWLRLPARSLFTSDPPLGNADTASATPSP